MQYRSGAQTRVASIPRRDAHDVAQAMELVRALRDQLRQMTREMARLEHLYTCGTSTQAPAIRCEAAALRRDINEATAHIDSLQLRYLNGTRHPQPRPSEQPRP